MKQQPSYYANIPATVRYDKDLKANEKLLYGEITALANKNGYCWAENNYFAELYGVKKGTVSGWISQLEKKGYVKTELIYQKGSKQVSRRFIYINDTPMRQKSHTPSDKNDIGYTTKIEHPMRQKSKEELNNTSTNNTSINKDSRNSGKPEYDDDSPYMKLSKRLFKHLKQRNPEQSEPNWQTWADDFRKTVELDKKSLENVTKILDWCQKDEFWRKNVMSPAKFRKQYDKLAIQMYEENGHGGGRSYGGLEF